MHSRALNNKLEEHDLNQVNLKLHSTWRKYHYYIIDFILQFLQYLRYKICTIAVLCLMIYSGHVKCSVNYEDSHPETHSEKCNV